MSSYSNFIKSIMAFFFVVLVLKFIIKLRFSTNIPIKEIKGDRLCFFLIKSVYHNHHRSLRYLIVKNKIRQENLYIKVVYYTLSKRIPNFSLGLNILKFFI